MCQNQGREQMKIDFAKGFTQAVADNAKVWEDRVTTVGASEVFGCIRSIFFKKIRPDLMDTVDDSLDGPNWGHTERGNLIENDFVVPKLRAMFGADKCLYMGTEQKTFKDGRLSATPDGIVIDLPFDALSMYGKKDINGDAIATEIKTFGGAHAEPRKYLIDGVAHYEAKLQHIGQNIVQMGAINKNTNFAPKTGAVLYVNPVNLKDIRVAIVDFDQGIYDHAKVRAESIYETGKTAADFRAEGLKGGNACTYCQFKDACQEIEMKAFPDAKLLPSSVDPSALLEVEKAVRHIAGLRAEYKKLELQKKAAEADLKDHLFNLRTNRLYGADWSVSISKRKGKKALDKEAMIEDGIDLEAYSKEGNPFFVTTIKA
jgi:hypothetical protein